MYPAGKNLNGALNSLVDAKAQTDNVTHPHFLKNIDVSCHLSLCRNLVKILAIQHVKETQAAMQSSQALGCTESTTNDIGNCV